MSVKVRCSNPACGHEFVVDEASVGKSVNCPQCGRLLSVDDPAQAAHRQRQPADRIGPGLWGLLCWALALCIFVALMAVWEGTVPPVWALLLNALVVLAGVVLVGWSGWSSFRRFGAIRPGRPERGQALFRGFIGSLAALAAVGIAVFVFVQQMDKRQDYYQRLCRNNLYRIAAAVNDYRASHGGRWPASLQQLRDWRAKERGSLKIACPLTGRNYVYLPRPEGWRGTDLRTAIIAYCPSGNHGGQAMVCFVASPPRPVEPNQLQQWLQQSQNKFPPAR